MDSWLPLSKTKEKKGKEKTDLNHSIQFNPSKL